VLISAVNLEVGGIGNLLTKELYSLDNMVIDFRMSLFYAELLMQSLSVHTDITSWQTNKLEKFKFNYSVSCQDGKGTDINSYYIGISPNWVFKKTEVIDIRMDFNPAKVRYNKNFVNFFNYIKLNSKSYQVKRFDLAIDVPVRRDKCYLLKDKREYSEYRKSNEDLTQYLGRRSHHGRIKLYNKAMEQGLDIPLTRLELTIDYSLRGALKEIFPTVYVLNDYQIDVDISGTDKVLLIACMGDMSLLKVLSRDKRKKIETLLKQQCSTLSVCSEKYNRILDEIQAYSEILPIIG
jgi:hypothetical protein